MSGKILGFVVLAACLLLGATIRLRGLSEQPQLLWDEGLFDTGARFLSWRWHQPQAAPSDYEGYPVFNEKPLHVLFLALASEAFGFRPLTGRALSGGFAVATLILVTARLLSLRPAGPWIAALGCLALAGSTYHSYYSRLGLHEIDSVFWLLAASTVAQSSRGSPLLRGIVSGVLSGLCLGSSYRWLPFLPLVVVLAAGTAWFGVDAGNRARRVGVSLLTVVAWTAGLGVVLAGCEALYSWTFAPDFVQYQPASYAAAMASKFQRETHFVLVDSGFFFDLLFTLDGPLWLVAIASLGVVGLGLRHARGRARWLYLEVLAFTLLPLAMFSISEAKVSRAVSVISPWLALAIGLAARRVLEPVSGHDESLHAIQTARGAGAGDLPHRLLSGAGSTGSMGHRTRPLAIAWVGIVVASGLWSASRALKLPEQLQSGYPEALAYVMSNSSAHLSSEAPISASMAGRRSVVWASLPRRALPATASELSKTIDDGAEFLILDWEKYLWYNPLLANLESSRAPALIVKNPCVAFPALLHETYLPADVRALRATARDLDEIRVYDLRGWR